jgi:hypothetical protein
MEDPDKQFKQILADYKLPEKQVGKNLTKNQRLALEIIEWCQIPKQFQGFWWRSAKRFTAYTEDRFQELKHRGIKNSAYLRKMIFGKT